MKTWHAKEMIWDDSPYDREHGPRGPTNCDDVSECGAYMCELGADHADPLHKSLSTGGSWMTGESVVHSSERVAMNVNDWIQVDEDGKEIRLVLPEGWKASILAAEPEFTLESDLVQPGSPGPSMLLAVTAKRVPT